MTDRIAHEEMRRLCPELTAKTELVLVLNPVTKDEAVYRRERDGWYLLTGSAAPQTPSPSAAPLSSGDGPANGPRQGDDGLVEPTGPTGSVPEAPGESNP